MRHGVSRAAPVLLGLALLAGCGGSDRIAGERAAAWPQFRGPGGSGAADDAAYPVAWDAARPETLQWRTPIPGLGHASPVIWGDRVFVTSAVSLGKEAEFSEGLSPDVRSSGDVWPQRWRVYCLDKRSGEMLWSRTAHDGAPKSIRHPKNSYATPTPAVDGRNLIVYFGSEGLFNYSLDGELRWRRSLGLLTAGYHLDPDQYQWGIGSSPVIVGDRVLVQCDIDRYSFLAAFDLSSGERLWRTPRKDGASWSTPMVYAIDDRKIAVLTAPEYVRGYDVADGSEVWRFRLDIEIIISSAHIAPHAVFVSAGKDDRRQPIVAIDRAASGNVSFQENGANPFIRWRREEGGPIAATALCHDGLLYLVDDDGELRCFDAHTGELRYEQALHDNFLSSPVIADGKLYIASDSGVVYVIRAGPRYELLAQNDMAAPILATPAFSEGFMVVRTTEALYGVTAKSSVDRASAEEPLAASATR